MRIFFSILLSFLLYHTPVLSQMVAATRVLTLMGSRFEIIAVHSNDTLAWEAVQSAILEIKRIEALISSWDPNSQTSRINRQAGINPVMVDEELYDLIFRAGKVSQITGGAFDISYAAVDPIWKFDGSVKELPDSATIRASVALVGYENIMLDPSRRTVFLPQKGMKIGFGAIGKGYAANRASQKMKEMGIMNGMVDAGGDLIAWGKQADGSAWKIGIVDPNHTDRIYAWLTIRDQSVVTSGDYERYVIIDDKRYAHIVDPRTGYPVSEVKSVTVVSPDAELSDALATAVFVLGPVEGIDLINKLEGIDCMLVSSSNEIITSNNLRLDYQ